MNLQRVLFACLTLLIAFSPLAHAAEISPELLGNLQKRIDFQHNPGFVIGIVDESGQSYHSFGSPEAGGTARPDHSTLYEIGSITKTFTTTLLAQMVSAGELKLNDPIKKFLPKNVSIPIYEGREITLEDLATHSSGLPRIPSNMNPADPANPYADYSVEQLYAFLNNHTLAREPGTKADYSNLGMGLLGHVLTEAAGKSFEELLTERVLKPLALSNTHFPNSKNASLRQALAPPYKQENGVLVPSNNWDITTLAGAGALLSTAEDMLRYLKAQLALTDSALQDAIELSHKPRQPFGPEQIGLGWIIRGEGEQEIYWHNGGTGGYRAFVGFSKVKKRGVVVLTNSVMGADDVGFHLLDSSHPLKEVKALRQRQAIDLPLSALEKLTGRYQLAPNFSIAIFLKDGKLISQATNQGPIELFAESPTTFFVKVVDAQVSFELDEAGVAKSLTLHQNGQNIPGKKLE